MVLFRLHAQDIDDLVEIEAISFPKPWSRNLLMEELTLPEANSFGVRMNHRSDDRSQDSAAPIIAYAFYRIVPDEMHVLKIAVAPEWRRRGVGRWLLNYCMNQAITRGAIRAFLELRPSNQAAALFYERFGFQIIGRRPKYYPETGEDALVLVKTLMEEI